MDDRIEHFIAANRSAFDDEEPSEKVWQHIARKRQKNSWGVLWKIAAVVFLISTTYLIAERNFDTSADEGQSEQLSEFTQVESYYTMLIAEKKTEISNMADGELKREFLLEIEQLDEQYGQLKQTYKNQHSGDLLMDAMINNLRLRIDILNQQLEILKKLKQQTDEEPINEV